MPTRIENIILRARDTLADPQAERYSDARLLRLVSEGQQDLVKQTRLLRDTYSLLPVPGQALYDLPEDIWMLTRATFLDREIEFRSYDVLDSDRATMSRTWQADTASVPVYLVQDRVNNKQIRVYPIPNEGIADNNYILTGGDPGFFGGEELGVVTDITDYSFDTVFGEVATLYDPFYETRYSSPYGVVTALSEVTAPIVLHYFKCAPELATVNDELLTPSMFDVALKHFVVGHALRDDIDTQFRQMGAESLALYERELMLAKTTSSLNSATNIDRTIQYTGAF